MPRITKTEWARIWSHMRQWRQEHIDPATGECNATQLGERAINEFDLTRQEDQDTAFDYAAELADNYNRRRRS